MAPAPTLPRRGLYAITDCRNLTTEQLLSRTEQVLRAGAAVLQYRNKEPDAAAVKHAQLSRLQALCRRYGTPFIINDEPVLAHRMAADGVHLGREDMPVAETRVLLGPDRIIGISCYNEFDRAISAARDGASYIALGSFFPSRTKPDAIRADPELIGRVKQALHIPVVAIGGITPENGGALLEAGADFLAVCSGLYLPADTFKTTRKYMALFNDL